MTISTPAYEATNEIDTAVEGNIARILEAARVTIQSALNPTTIAVNPLTTVTFTQNFGVIAAGAAQRNFNVVVTFSENDSTDATGAIVETD